MFRQGGVRSSSKFHKAKAWRIQICTFCYAVNAVFWIDFCNCFHWYISIYGCILLQKCWIALWIRIAAQYLLRVAVHIFSVLFEVLLYVHIIHIVCFSLCITISPYATWLVMHFFIFLLYNSLSYTSFFIVGESVIANVKQRQADDTCTEKVT